MAPRDSDILRDEPPSAGSMEGPGWMDALTREPIEVRSRPRTGRVVAILLSVLALAGIVYTVWFWPATAPEQPATRPGANFPIPVIVAPAARRDTPVWLDGLGTVQASQSVTVRSMVEGPLVAVNFREGQAVRQGDVLAQIDPRPYQAALDSAVARKAQNEALLANARLDLARYQKLVASNFTSAQQADTAKSEVERIAAVVAQDQAAIDNARTQLSYATITAPIDGRAGMRLVDAGNIVRPGDATGLVVIAQLQPINVMFTLPQQHLPAIARAMANMPGANAPPNADARPAPSPLATSPLATSPQVGPAGTGGAIPVIALPQGAVVGGVGSGDGARILDRGTLTVLDNQVDPLTGTIKLKATFPNTDSRLWPGGFVGVRLRVDVLRDVVMVPTAAIQRGPRGAYVYVARADATASRQPVTVGYEDERGSVILKGLQGGERVVVDGASRLADGSRIAPTLADQGTDAAPGGGPPTPRRQRMGG
jgi:multidrug efflux system membrane fusion protein